jgi:hypothetical protein
MKLHVRAFADDEPQAQGLNGGLSFHLTKWAEYFNLLEKAERHMRDCSCGELPAYHVKLSISSCKVYWSSSTIILGDEVGISSHDFRQLR